MFAISQGWIPDDLMAVAGIFILIFYIIGCITVGVDWICRKIKGKKS